MIDVCLILEGTYPYVTGGVSTCVYNLICQMPQVNFGIFYIGASSTDKGELKYPVPENIVSFKEVFIQDYDYDEPPKARMNKKTWKAMHNLHHSIFKGETKDFEHVFDTFFSGDGNYDASHLLFSEESWKLIRKLYEGMQRDVPFLDYFWNWRMTHLPMFHVMEKDIPKANMYHTLCTGYAGLLGVKAKMKHKSPLLLTEHGIYTYERKMEISESSWIRDYDEEELMAKETLSFFRQWWLRTFEGIGRLTYTYSDRIVTLFEGNRKRQIDAGAEPERCFVIPNGMNIAKFTEVAKKHKSRVNGKWMIGFVGRVVPIKDVKTFIRAVSLVHSKMKDIEVAILGPYAEDLEYYEDCVSLVEFLGLKEVIKFHGRVDVMEWYQKIDLTVLLVDVLLAFSLGPLFFTSLASVMLSAVTDSGFFANSLCVGIPNSVKNNSEVEWIAKRLPLNQSRVIVATLAV